MQILSLCLSALGFLALVIASLTKGDKIKRILILVFLANLLYAVGYTVGGSGINGAASCYLGALISLINYFFDAANKPIPKWLAVLYGVAFAVLNVAVGGFSVPVAVAIMATLAFVLCIGQKSGAKYRFWTAVNLALWCTYDVMTASFGTLAVHIAQILFTVLGMLLFDRKKDIG